MRRMREPALGIALGPSGAGKTTTLSLPGRLIEPNAGRIRLGGRDLAAIPLTELRQLITLVPQDPWLHTGTVADNIRYGRPEASMAEIHAAAQLAGAAELITRLANGYDTPVGAHGRHLCGGQQRYGQPRLRATGSAGHALNAAVFIALYATPWYAPVLSVTRDAALNLLRRFDAAGRGPWLRRLRGTRRLQLAAAP